MGMVTMEYMRRGLYGMMCLGIGSLIILAAEPAESRFHPLPDSSGAAEVRESPEPGRAGLPYAFGRRFSTLDQYLEHLRRHAAPIDLPWWRQIGPDRYERITGKRIPPGRREEATRAELMQRFGFAR